MCTQIGRTTPTPISGSSVCNAHPSAHTTSHTCTPTEDPTASQRLANGILQEELSLIQGKICQSTGKEFPKPVISAALAFLKKFHSALENNQTLLRTSAANLTIIPYGKRAYLKYSTPSASGAKKTGGIVLDLLNLQTFKFSYEGKSEKTLEMEICMRKAIHDACIRAGIPNTICEPPLSDSELIVEPYDGDGFTFAMDEFYCAHFLYDFVQTGLRHLIEIRKIGLTHADIKLENFLFRVIEGKTPKLETKLIDFETAFFDDEDNEKATLNGTPLYIPPELLHATSPAEIQERNGPARDVWALGITLATLCVQAESPWLPSSFRDKIGAILEINRIFADAMELPENQAKSNQLTLKMVEDIKKRIDEHWIEPTDCRMNLQDPNGPALTKEELLTKEHDFSCFLYYMLQKDPSQRLTAEDIQTILDKQTLRFCC